MCSGKVLFWFRSEASLVAPSRRGERQAPLPTNRAAKLYLGSNQVLRGRSEIGEYDLTFSASSTPIYGQQAREKSSRTSQT